MKPVYNGVTIVLLATGITLLSLMSLGGCSKSEDDKAQQEGSAATSSTEAEQQARPAAKVIKNDGGENSNEVLTGKTSDTSQTMTEAGLPATAPPPPPGLFQSTDKSVQARQAEQPAAPVMPISPQTPAPLSPPEQPTITNHESAAPVAPENTQAPQAPKKASAPAALPVSVEAAGKTKPAQAARKALNIPPPPMPKIEDFKAHEVQQESAPVAVNAPQQPIAPSPANVGMPPIQTPEAPELDVPEVVKPASQQGNAANGAPQNAVPTAQPGGTAGTAPMGSSSMRLPSPSMNMGEPAMNQNMNPGAMYVPKVYFVPVPMYQYAQPYMPYGYSAGPVYGNQQSQQPGVPIKPQSEKNGSQ